MTTRYCGIGGDDGNSGLTWALRKLTLNGIEDTPVVAGDTNYIGPGVYREQLTVDVDGGAGNLITYIGDITGKHTDGVGGIVRITGSDDDQAATRASCIVVSAKNYRTFRGFTLDTGTDHLINGNNPTHLVVEDCSLQNGTATKHLVWIEGNQQSNVTIRRCFFPFSRECHIFFYSPTTVDANHHVENSVFLAARSDSVALDKIGDTTIKNCLFIGTADDHVDSRGSPNAGHPVLVYNCILIAADSKGIEANIEGDVVEDYNTFYGNYADRLNVAVGANSVTYPPLFSPPLLLNGFKFPWAFGTLSKWSQMRALTGSNEPATDLFGIARPATASKNSWGAIQYHGIERETGTTHDTSAASIKLADAARHQIFVPVTNEETTITVYCYREANYTGTLPQMVIKQPGQSDRTMVDTGNAATWNQLSDTFTPSANTDFVVVELVSNNTAVTGSYAAFFDTLEVS